MRHVRKLGIVLVVLVLGVVGTTAEPVTAKVLATRRACRAACGPLIRLCEEAGVKRRACRRRILRDCRRIGLGYCDTSVTTTTTPFPSTTSTTLDPGPTVNGCNRQEAEDHRDDAFVLVRFDVFDFSPECILVSSGTTVRFQGTFDTCPLYGGANFAADPTSPFMPPTTDGFSKDFILQEPGIFGYYCDWALSLVFRTWGAVIVDP